VSDPDESHGSLAEVGRYQRLAAARERGLVMAARELPHWLKREGREWVLYVEEEAQEAALRELAAFEAEEEQRPPARPVLFAEKIPALSLFVAGWVLSAFFFAQRISPPSWEERGAAESAAILRGEWWRTITALTLHADGPHLAANLATGLLFAAFVVPQLGSGLAWLAILLSGALGNAINAWGYRGEPHFSIGASTACFGALGLLVGAELLVRWREPGRRNRWQLIVPLGAGLALLAFLGVGEEGKNIDYMAHGWGLLVGLAEGLLAEALRVKERAPPFVQRLAAAGTLVLIGVAWMFATA
jgi:membrane associated rhomboid family serine protease